MPTSVLNNKSPFQVLYNSIPAINHIRVFGSSCFPLLRPFNSSKLQIRTTKCVFLSYASKFKGYICYEVLHRRIYISRHVLFDESEFPYSNLILQVSHSNPSTKVSVSSPIVVVPNSQNVLVMPQHHQNVHSIPSPEPVPNPALMPSSIHVPISALDSQSATEEHSITLSTQSSSYLVLMVPYFLPESLQVVLSIPPLNLHPMQTRSKSGISKKIALLSAIHEHGGVDLTKVGLATYKSALKSSIWTTAMKE